MLKLKTEDDLRGLHTGNVKESLHLEYKASDAIDKRDDKKKIEMARDVSAFANADGGQIVYGMTEKEHEPAGLDEGFDPKAYPEIWFEQVLQQHITPIIEGLRPYHVTLESGRVAVVIDVPATKGDPHQVDGRYYRRHNYNRLMMEHYEVRALFHRAVNPELYVDLSFATGSTHALKFKAEQEFSEPVEILAVIGNRSATPALYAQVTLSIDADFKIHRGGYNYMGEGQDGDTKYVEIYEFWSVHDHKSPVFKELEFPLIEENFAVSVHSRHLQSTRFSIKVDIAAPGFAITKTWYVTCQGGTLRLLPPRS